MKQDIHPKTHEIIVQMTNGKTFTTMSTYGKKGDILIVDIDPHNHQAWTKVKKGAMENVSNVAKYRKRFGSINIFGNSSASDGQDNSDNSTSDDKDNS